MGKYFLDQYSLLHFTSGVVCRYLNLSFILLLVLHIIFEYVENSQKGMYFINNYFKLWPGGKTSSDTFVNSFGDILFSLIGWIAMDILMKSNLQKIGAEFCLGVLMYFWLFPKHGFAICAFLTFLIYSIYRYNLFYGFLLSLLLDKIGLHYGFYQAHVV